MELRKDVFEDTFPSDVKLQMQMDRSLVKNTRNKNKLKRKYDATVQRLSKMDPNKEINRQKNIIITNNETNFKIVAKPEVIDGTMCRIVEKHAQVRPPFEKPSVRSSNDTDAEHALYHQNIKELEENKPHLRNALEHPLTSRTFVVETSDALPKVEGDLQALIIRMALTSTDHDSQGEIIEENKIMPDSEIHHTKLVLVTNQLKLDDMDFLQIKPLNNYSKRDLYLVGKFVKRWKEYIEDKKKASINHRQELTLALNAFFHSLENKKNGFNSQTDLSNKAKLNARDYSNYQHRYKMQKHIIALQKAKLEEQTRLIDELKYNKIVEASKNSVETMREELRKTYFEIDRHLKPKIKCLTNELKIPEIEEQSLVLQCLKMPQFLQRMEKRAREREEKHALIRERRRQMEEERVRLKQQAEIAKAEMDKEDRIRMIKELKEKRKREKIENIRKKQLAERMRALQVMADLHYERNLVSRCGLQPWKRLLDIKRDNYEKARSHYRFQLLKNMFLKWMFHTEDMWIERNYKAEDFYRKKILHRIFGAFKTNYHELVLKKQVADDYYDLYVVQLAFRRFRRGVERIKYENALKWDRAVAYHNSNLMFKIFTWWRSLPALNALEREQEARKARWREKVLQVVPDYRPPED